MHVVNNTGDISEWLRTYAILLKSFHSLRTSIVFASVSLCQQTDV